MIFVSDVLNRLKMRERQDAGKLEMTCHKPDVFLMRAQRFEEAAALEQKQREAMYAEDEAEWLNGIWNSNRQVWRRNFELQVYLAVVVGILVGLCVAAFIW